jgi:hypothetical protein
MIRRIALLAGSVMFIAAFLAAPSHGQGLFGGGGLLGGGGGFGGGGFGGGGLLGGGGFGGGPIARPAPAFGGGRPILGGGPSIGGGAPILRPSISRPIAGPAPSISRPILGGGSGIGNRPSASILPGGGSRPILGDRPVIDWPIAGDRPIIDRPIAGNRPIAGGLPAVGGGPGAPIPPVNLPGTVRPSQPVTAGQLDDFLRPPSAGTADVKPPMVGDRPGGLDANRPIAGQLPAGDLPGIGDGPGLGDRPIFGDRPIVDRPIMPNLGEEILGEEIRNEIIARRIERGAWVRDRIAELYYRENHPFAYWWGWMWSRHPVWTWWNLTVPYRWATWSSVSSWCGYSGSYAQPTYYEYTSDGVYANGQQVVVDEEYTRQARELAKAGAALLQQKIDSQQTDTIEWLPLGVFSLCDTSDGDPTMFLQLAISREAIVAGSYANTQTNENLSVQGGADRESKRLAITIGDADDVVVETGLHGVTEDQSSALIHFDGSLQSWLLVRMPPPQEPAE